MLILIISTFIANHVTNVIFHDEAKRLVENYISDNMDGKYLVEVARCYPEVNKIDEWKGKTYVRWKAIRTCKDKKEAVDKINFLTKMIVVHIQMR